MFCLKRKIYRHVDKAFGRIVWHSDHILKIADFKIPKSCRLSLAIHLVLSPVGKKLKQDMSTNLRDSLPNGPISTTNCADCLRCRAKIILSLWQIFTFPLFRESLSLASIYDGSYVVISACVLRPLKKRGPRFFLPRFFRAKTRVNFNHRGQANYKSMI